MNDKEIRELLRNGNPKVIVLDPLQKDSITRASLAEIQREIKSALTRKKMVTILTLD